MQVWHCHPLADVCYGDHYGVNFKNLTPVEIVGDDELGAMGASINRALDRMREAVEAALVRDIRTGFYDILLARAAVAGSAESAGVPR